MKERVIRFALVFFILASTVYAGPSSAAIATVDCPTALAAEAIPEEELPPAEMLTIDQIHQRARELQQVFHEECSKRPCSPDQKKRAFWKVALGIAYRWTLQPVLTRVAPIGLLSGGIFGTMMGMLLIDQNFSDKSAVVAGTVFGMITTPIITTLTSPAMTPIASKLGQISWMLSRIFKGKRISPYQANPAELDELYALTQQLVRLTAQCARSVWYEHTAIAEARHMEAADKWLGASLNREVVVPNILAMSLRRITKRFPEIDLLGDLEIEREFRVNFRNQFTLAALQTTERLMMAGEVLAALEQIEWEVEEVELSSKARKYFVELLDVLIVNPSTPPRPPTKKDTAKDTDSEGLTAASADAINS